jgi:hypothetical protein
MRLATSRLGETWLYSLTGEENLRLAKTYCAAFSPGWNEAEGVHVDQGKAPDHSGAIQQNLEKSHGFTGCLWMPNHRSVVPAYPAAPLGVRTRTSSPEMLLAYSSAGSEPPVVAALAAWVAPALLAARAEKAVLRIIATESAIFVTLDIVLSPSFVRRRGCDGTPDKIDKLSRYSRRGKTGASLQVTFSSPVSEACR